MKMSVVNNMSHKNEEEKPTLSVRPSKSLLSNRAQLLEMKERIGVKKYSKIRYNTTVHKQKKGEPNAPRAAPQNEIKDLCARLNNMCPREVKGVGKAFDALVKRVEKKIEKKKNYFKNNRWKRAQDANELVKHQVVYETLDGRIHRFSITIPSRIRPDIISYTTCVQVYSKLNFHDFRIALQSYIQERLLAIKMSETPKSNFVNKALDCVDDKISNILNGINCPHCSKNNKCSTCILDKPGCLSNHQLRVLEDIIIAFVQVLLKRDVMTFIFEFIRILKTMFGVSIVNFDYVKLLPHILNPIIRCACFVNIKISDVTGFDITQIIEFLMNLFNFGPEKKAQDSKIKNSDDLGGKPLDEMGTFDTKLSDWMDTDIFRFGSNWFSYMCYLCISKKDCTNLPFLGDLMRATIDDGKKTSKDLLKYSIKTMEFVISKGKFCIEHGFITTFYHSSSTLSSVRRRYDRLCEQYLCKGNPKVYGLDIKVFAKELSAMRKELTDLSRIGSLKVKDEISKMLTRVIVMDNDIRSDANVFKTRRAPFSLLIWGKTAIAKSTFVDLTTKVNCDVHGYKYAPEYIYTKNNDDERMDGYKSDMHTTVCDDVGNKHPNFSMNGDPSVTNIIQFNNNVASLTRQAEVEDKGKIPFQSDFIYFTSNTEHINAMYYMCYPAAVMRRFNYILKLELKPAYATNGMFDATKPDIDYTSFNF